LAYFEKLSTIDLSDVVATFQEAVIIVADFNIHLERSDDPITKQLTALLCDYWFSVRPTTATQTLAALMMLSLHAVSSLTAG